MKISLTGVTADLARLCRGDEGKSAESLLDRVSGSTSSSKRVQRKEDGAERTTPAPSPTVKVEPAGGDLDIPTALIDDETGILAELDAWGQTHFRCARSW